MAIEECCKCSFKSILLLNIAKVIYSNGFLYIFYRKGDIESIQIGTTCKLVFDRKYLISVQKNCEK